MESDNNKWQRRYFSIWSGQAVSLITSELVQFALVWWLVEETGSALIVSFASMIVLLPGAVFGPLLGVLVDRWNRKAILILADLGIMLSLLWLAFQFYSGTIQTWQVIVVMFLRAVGGAFHLPAMLASTSMLIPEKHLARVAGMNQFLNGLFMIVVPPLGAILLNRLPFGLAGIIGLDVVGALVAIFPLFFFSIPQPEVSPATEAASSIQTEFMQGLRYIRAWKGAAGMLLISTLINFIMRPSFQLVSITVVNHYGGDEVAYGWMGAAIGGGFMAGGILLSIWGGFRRQMQTSLTGIVGAGMAIILVGLSTADGFLLGLTGIFLAGMMMPLCMGPIQALIQSSVEASLQGRVLAIMNSASSIISPISLLLAGPLFDRLGPTPWYFWGGVAAVFIGLIGFANTRILNLGAPQSSRSSQEALQEVEV